MSSILNALRKLEAEIPPTIRKQTWPRARFAGKADSRRLGRPRPRYLLLSLLFVIAASTFAGGYYHNRISQLLTDFDPSAILDNFRNTTASTPKADKTAPDKKPATNNPGVKQPVDVKKEKPMIDDTSGTYSAKLSEKKTSAPAAPKKPPLRTDSSGKPRPHRQVRQPESPSRTRRTQRPARSVEKAVSRQPSNPVNTSPPVAKADGTKWALQAIAWSNDPKERIAVINGQVLREGDSFEGITIIGIGKDAVTIRDGTRRAALEFRLK